MNSIKTGGDALFILLGTIMILAMHAGLAFPELGTVRGENQVNALVEILVDFTVSTIAYFFIGYSITYGVNSFTGADVFAQQGGYELVKFLFLPASAAAIPTIISGGIAKRSRFEPQLATTFVLVGFAYPFFKSIAWNERFGIQHWLQSVTSTEFHDFTGSVVVHAVGGWIALPAVLLLGARYGRYKDDGHIATHPPSNVPFLAADAWVLAVGWFGFNVIGVQTLGKMSGLAAINSLMAMVGSTLTAWWMGKNDPGSSCNGPLAGLVAMCAGSDVMHSLRALAVGGIMGVLFVWIFTRVRSVRRIDDVLGVWPLYGLCGAWGSTVAGIFGLRALGGLGGVSFWAQVTDTAGGIVTALVGDTVVYGTLRKLVGLRLDRGAEFMDANLAVHHVSSTPESETHW